MDSSQHSVSALQQAWPQEGLENLRSCPLCNSPKRAILHQGLRDNIFFVAPGEWTLWRCDNCRSAYLDPRPTPETIGLAYSHYYTHKDDLPTAATNRLQRLRAALGNGYRNWRYGTRLRPASALGIIAAFLFPAFRLPVDLSFRFLPRMSRRRKGRILDVGCGSGDWLLNARLAGWDVAGADPDPVAVERGRNAGLDIRQGGVEAWANAPASIDCVTLNHVIEHVHLPMQTLQALFSLLKPGGQLFIETPNVDAWGHRLYGTNWRGLEPPRHLVLFNRKSLDAALKAAGFVRIRHHRRPQTLAYLGRASERMATGGDPYDDSISVKGPSLWLRLLSALSYKRREYLILTCEKPG